MTRRFLFLSESSLLDHLPDFRIHGQSLVTSFVYKSLSSQCDLVAYKRTSLFNPKRYFQLLATIASYSKHCKVIYFNPSRSLFGVLLELPLYLFFLIFQFRAVLHIHGNELQHTFNSPIIGGLLAAVVNSSVSDVIFPTSTAASRVSPFLPYTSIHVIPNPVLLSDIEVGGFATAMHIPLVITSMQNISLFIRLLKPSLFLVDLDSIEKRHTHLIKRYKHKLAVHDYFQVDQPYLKSFNKYDIDDIDEMVDLFFSVASQNLDKMDRSLLENNDRVYVTGSPMYDRLRNTQILSSPLQEHQRYYTFVQDHPRPNTISFGATDPKHSSALKMFRVANRNCSMELWSGRFSLHLVASIFILSAGLQIYRSIAKAFCSQQSESCRSKYPLSACLRQIDTLSLKYKVAANLTGVFMKIY